MITHLKRLNKFLLILKVHYRELIIGDGALSLGWLVCKSLELGYDVHDMPYCLFPHLKNLFQIIMIAFLIQSTSRIMNPSAIYQFQPHCNTEFNKQIIENHIRKTKTKKNKEFTGLWWGRITVYQSFTKILPTMTPKFLRWLEAERLTKQVQL